MHAIGGNGECDIGAGVEQKPSAMSGWDTVSVADGFHGLGCQSFELPRGQIFLAQLDVVHPEGGGFGDLVDQAAAPLALIAGKLPAVRDVVQQHAVRRWTSASEYKPHTNSTTRPHIEPLVDLANQVVWLFVMALAIASVSWTVTQEEIFHEARLYAQRQSESARQGWRRKLFYPLTCHYCFSHYVAAFFVGITGYKLLSQRWPGYLISFFAVVWVANLYMSVYAWLRQEFKREKFEAKVMEHEAEEKTSRPHIEKPAA